MDCFKFMDRNLIDNASLSSSTENALFPISNIQDTRRTKVFRTTANTGWVVFDLQESQLIDTIFIVASQKSGFGISTLTLELNATNNWTSPAFSTSVTFSTSFNVGFKEFTQQSYRFARLVFTSTLSYCEIGKVYLGKSLGMTRGISFNWTIKDEELSLKQRNRYGQVFSDIIGRQNVISFAIRNMDKEDLDKINKLLDIHGESKPVYMILGSTEMVNDNRRFSGPVLIEDMPTISNPYFNKYNLSLTVRELM